MNMSNLNEDASKTYGVLTRFQTAIFFQVSLRTIDSWVRDGYLKSTKVGGKVYFFEEDILEALKRNYR